MVPVSRLLLAVALVLAAFRGAAPVQEEKVDFLRDIQPIFKASCHKCHGPEKPKGQFRLDLKAFALKGGISGKAILPGKGSEGPLVRLLLESNEEARMPQKAPPLAREKIDLIRRWIDQGAEWPDSAAGEAKPEKHWAYARPVRPAVPAVRNAAWVRNPIDAFVLARLEQEEPRVPEPPARPALPGVHPRLARRLTSGSTSA